jgi:hypothetical protein
VVGSGRILGLDGFEPGVFSRRLIKMAVNADIVFRGSRLIGHKIMIAEGEII